MSRGKLPEGVGKKIVEALKKQAELDLKPELQENQLNAENQENIDINDQQINQIEETSINNDNDSLISAQKDNTEEITTQTYPNPEPLEDSINKNSFNIDFSKPSKDFSNFEKTQADKTVYNKPISQQFNSKPMFSLKDEPKISMDKSLETRWNFNSSFDSSKDTNLHSFTEPLSMSIQESKDFDVPTNVAVLRNLIKQLPSGVAKQTGAQIIRQTLEALGISMSSVLNEAQGVQDSLNDSIRECMSTIQEYKNQMMVLEKQAQDYQRQVSQLNDLISLFIMTDKK